MKPKGKIKEEARKTFRLSFHKIEHKDVIEIIERNSKTLRCELIAEAVRYFWNNRFDAITKAEKSSEEATHTLPGKTNIGEFFTRS